MGIIAFGAMIFSEEIDYLFPTTSATVIESISTDVSNISSKATNIIESKLDESIDKAVEKTSSKISEKISDEIDVIGDSVSDNVTELGKSSQEKFQIVYLILIRLKKLQNYFLDLIFFNSLINSGKNFALFS